MKEKTEQDAYLQLAALCAQAEHCQQEMRDKMKRWDIDAATQDRIVARLIKERYVDDAMPVPSSRTRSVTTNGDPVRFSRGCG